MNFSEITVACMNERIGSKSLMKSRGFSFFNFYDYIVLSLISAALTVLFSFHLLLKVNLSCFLHCRDYIVVHQFNVNEQKALKSKNN